MKPRRKFASNSRVTFSNFNKLYALNFETTRRAFDIVRPSQFPTRRIIKLIIKHREASRSVSVSSPRSQLDRIATSRPCTCRRHVSVDEIAPGIYLGRADDSRCAGYLQYVAGVWCGVASVWWGGGLLQVFVPIVFPRVFRPTGIGGTERDPGRILRGDCDETPWEIRWRWYGTYGTTTLVNVVDKRRRIENFQFSLWIPRTDFKNLLHLKTNVKIFTWEWWKWRERQDNVHPIGTTL